MARLVYILIAVIVFIAACAISSIIMYIRRRLQQHRQLTITMPVGYTNTGELIIFKMKLFVMIVSYTGAIAINMPVSEVIKSNV
jgi:hypothetical protein